MTVNEIVEQYEAAQAALHVLLRAAVGAPGYDKKTWQALSNALDRIARSAATAAGLPPTVPLVTGATATGHEPRFRVSFHHSHLILCCSCGFEPGGSDADTAMAFHLALFKAAP